MDQKMPMDTKQKNDKLQIILQRYDSYYNATGVRGNIYLTINVAILAGLMTGYFTSDKAYVGKEMVLLVVFALLCNFSAIICTLQALRPVVANKISKIGYTSVFSSIIRGRHPNHYDELWQNMDENNWHEDLKTQLAVYSRGMEYKFKALTRATWLTGIQVLTIVIFALSLLTPAFGVL